MNRHLLNTKKGGMHCLNTEESLEEENPNVYSWLLLDSDGVYHSTDKSLASSCLEYLSDPNHRPYRYIIVILVSLIEGILCFCVDFPAGIQSTMIRVMKLDNFHYDMYFSASTWPDIVMSVFGSIIVNKFLGMRKGMVIFSTIVLIGQTIISVGAYINIYWVMLLGRIIFGCGVGTGVSLVSAFVIIWFSGKEVTFVTSLTRCIHRMNATLALLTPQFIYDGLRSILVSFDIRHGTTVMLCTVLCLFGFMCAVMVALLDWRGAKMIGRKPFSKQAITGFSSLNFSSSFWILALIISLFFAVVTSFTANAPLYFVSKYGFTKNTANIANSFSYLAVVFTTPFIALLIDVMGYNLIWGVFGIGCAMMSNIIYLVSNSVDTFAPYVAAVLYSVSFSLVGTALWVAPGFLVPKHQLTTAYGVVMSMLALTRTIVNVLSGEIIDHFGYLVLVVYLFSLLFIAFALAVFLSSLEITVDQGVRLLNVSGKKRRSKH